MCKKEISKFVEWTGDDPLPAVGGQAKFVLVGTTVENA